MSNEITTTNLADFGQRERALLIDLLEAWNNEGLPEDFYDDEVVPMMNVQSGNVFLTNSDFQVAMMNGSDLESWYYTPYSGHEGFADSLKDDYEEFPENWVQDDIQYLFDMGIIGDEYDIVED